MRGRVAAQRQPCAADRTVPSTDPRPCSFLGLHTRIEIYNQARKFAEEALGLYLPQDWFHHGASPQEAMVDLEQKLKQLASKYPLPNDYELQDPFVDHLRLGPLELGMAGLIAMDLRSGQETIGAAAGPGDVPIQRAYFELLERTYTLHARDQGRRFVEVDEHGRAIGELDHHAVFGDEGAIAPHATRSFTNGVALHRSPVAACRNARSELIERDQLLRAWYGFCDVTAVRVPEGSFYDWAQEHYDVRACRFGGDVSPWAYSAGILAYPYRATQAPLLFASGGGQSLQEALARSERELLQRLAFLWGEDIPREAPTPTSTVDYHQAYHLVPRNHGFLQSFFGLGHRRFCEQAPPPQLQAHSIRFADLRTPGFPESLCLVRAISSDALPVLFGHDQLTAQLPAALQVHPIS